MLPSPLTALACAGAFPNDFSSDALGISTDGSVVVGFHQDSRGNPQAYRLYALFCRPTKGFSVIKNTTVRTNTTESNNRTPIPINILEK
jgi:uncharacterized membrane protein